MADLTQLENEVQKIIDTRNSRELVDDTWSFEMAEHRNGPAIDVTCNDEEIDKISEEFAAAASTAGYMITGTYVSEFKGKTRIFLSDASEYFDINSDAVSMSEAQQFIDNNNSFFGSAVRTKNNDDDKLHVYAPEHNAATATTPDGWIAYDYDPHSIRFKKE